MTFTDESTALEILGYINEGMDIGAAYALVDGALDESIHNYFTPKSDTHGTGKSLRWKSAPNKTPIWKRLNESRDPRKDRFDYREFTRSYIPDETERIAHRFGFHRGIYPD